MAQFHLHNEQGLLQAVATDTNGVHLVVIFERNGTQRRFVNTHPLSHGGPLNYWKTSPVASELDRRVVYAEERIAEWYATQNKHILAWLKHYITTGLVTTHFTESDLRVANYPVTITRSGIQAPIVVDDTLDLVWQLIWWMNIYGYPEWEGGYHWWGTRIMTDADPFDPFVQHFNPAEVDYLPAEQVEGYLPADFAQADGVTVLDIDTPVVDAAPAGWDVVDTSTEDTPVVVEAPDPDPVFVEAPEPTHFASHSYEAPEPVYEAPVHETHSYEAPVHESYHYEAPEPSHYDSHSYEAPDPSPSYDSGSSSYDSGSSYLSDSGGGGGDW